jgi:DNA-binding GntR family transcriptional regulator
MPMIGARGPRYHQVAANLRARIRDGRYRPGQRLPAETSLAAECDVGVDTVRAAIALLRNEGLVVTRHGYGTKVAEQHRREVIHVPRGTRIGGRMAGPEDRERWDIPEGAVVAMLVVGDEAWPSDRFEVVTD